MSFDSRNPRKPESLPSSSAIFFSKTSCICTAEIIQWRLSRHVRYIKVLRPCVPQATHCTFFVTGFVTGENHTGSRAPARTLRSPLRGRERLGTRLRKQIKEVQHTLEDRYDVETCPVVLFNLQARSWFGTFFFRLSRQSVYLPVCLSVCLPVCLSVCVYI